MHLVDSSENLSPAGPQIPGRGADEQVDRRRAKWMKGWADDWGVGGRVDECMGGWVQGQD